MKGALAVPGRDIRAMIPAIINVHTEFFDGSQTVQVAFDRTGPSGEEFHTFALVDTNRREGVGGREVQGPYAASHDGLLDVIRAPDPSHLRAGVALAIVDDATAPLPYYWHTAVEFLAVKTSYELMEGFEPVRELPMPDLVVNGRRCSVTLFVFSKPTEPPRASAYLLPWALSGHVLGVNDHPTFTYALVKLALD